MPKEKGRSLIASNRKARHDYLIDDTFEAGIVLSGTEVKALRMGRASLVDGFAMFTGDEALPRERPHPRVPQRHVEQPRAAPQAQACSCTAQSLTKIAHKTRESGRTIVPLALYFKDGRAKVEIAIATGKKEYDKRHALRERQDNREADRAMSAANRRR